MSAEAYAAAQKFKTGSAARRAVLLCLANLCDENASCFPSFQTIAERTELSRSTVIRCVDDLEAMGVLKRENRKRADSDIPTSNRYSLDFSAGGSVTVTLPQCQGDTTLVSPCDYPSVTVTLQEKVLRSTGSDEPDTGAREADFDRLAKAWKAVSPGRLSPVRAEQAFVVAATEVDPARILAAGLRYLAEDPDVKRLKTAIGLHVWLAERRYEAWLPDPTLDDAPIAARSWCGPSEIRAAVVAQRGERFAVSYLDPAGWDGAAIVPRTGAARAKLAELRDPPLTLAATAKEPA